MNISIIGLFHIALRPTAIGVKRFGVVYLKSILARRDKFGAAPIRQPWGALFLRPKNSDFDVYNQIFLQRDYDLSGFKQWERITGAYDAIVAAGRVPIIIDAGANVGLASVWFAMTFPRAKILAVEPDPDNAALARKNGAPFGSIKVIEAALGAQAGRVTLSRPEAAAWAVTTERSESGDVPIVTMDGLLAEAGEKATLFIAKIDIEGFEKDVFSANLDWMRDLTVLIVELHDWMLPGQGVSAPVLAATQGLGFDLLVKGENLVFVRWAQA
jgi:FkbM family methyltransferase